ncbi:alpha/beta-hydrolase [Amniculicola lignicola CBS 123094]|uniref:Alpha/beta-hydrolase n=1 Tax=Amniculicola lignicola CBS 123094 TaxID=1392246 RepID=A0A6A5W2I1_9PLEO|nr:alpha/beta-hydrolase [Amniculicola lignicola CBS 123094]
MSKPMIIIVPGSFALASFYDPVTKPFTSLGYTIHTIQLVTSIKKPGPLPTLADDAALVAKTVTQYADEGKDIVLVTHSYGGAPGTEGAKGLSKAEREKEGKKGGIVRIAYLTSLVPKVGQAAGEVLANGTAPKDMMAADEDGWLYHVDPARSAEYCCNDLPAEQGTAFLASFPQHSSVSFAGVLTYASYLDVPVSWLFAENDKCVTPNVQQECIDMVERESGNKVDVTRIETDHIPIVGHPQKVIDWFVKLVEGDK